MKSLPFLLFLLFFSVVTQAQQQWHPIGPDDYNQISYNSARYHHAGVTDSNNVTYMAFDDLYGSNNGKITVRKFVNGYWENVGAPAFSADGISSISLVIDSNDTLYVSYTDVNTVVKKFNGTAWVTVGDPVYNAYGSQLTIDAENRLYITYVYGNNYAVQLKKFNGTSWVSVGGNVTDSNGNYPSVKVTQDNIPYVTYVNNNAGGRATVKKLVANTWQTVGAANISGGTVENPNIYLDGNDVPYVSYTNTPNVGQNTVSVKKFNGSEWESLNIEADSGNTATNILLAFNSSNVPYAIYSKTGHLTCYVRTYNGTTWDLTGTVFEGFNANIFFDSDGNLHAGYRDGKLGVKKLVGAEWEELGSHGISASSNLLHAEMTVTNDNNFYFSYAEGSPNRVYVKKWSGSNWEQVAPEGLDELNTAYPRIIASTSNIPYLAYKNYQSNFIRIKKYENNTWVNAAPAVSAQIGTYSIAISPNNTFYLSYTFSDRITTDIKTKKYDGSSWINLPDITNISVNSQPEIVVGSDNALYIVYCDRNSGSKVMVKKMNVNATTWTNVGTTPISAGAAHSVFIALDSQNMPYVSYSDSNPVTGTYKATVQKFNGTAWEVVGASRFTPSDVTKGSLSLDNNNTPYFVHHDSNEAGGINVFKFDGTSWVPVGTQAVSASSSSSLMAPRIAFTSDNLPIVSYKTIGIYAKYFGDEIMKIPTGAKISKAPVLYPNPVNDKLHFSNYDGIKSVQIFDLQGKLIMETQVVQPYIPLNFKPGFYFVKVKTASETNNYKIYKQ